jgi:hypothetical protein
MKFKIILLTVLLCLIASCGLVPRSSGPMNIGPDTWKIMARASVGSLIESQRMAMDEGLAHCAALGKKFLVIGTSRVASFEVTYRCLFEGDPELLRPTLEKAPDTVIQVR